MQYIVNAARGFEFVNVYSAAGLLILLIMLHKVACLPNIAVDIILANPISDRYNTCKLISD